MRIYVVYITLYRGSRLPPFYIGWSFESRVINGYRGSVMSQEYKEIWKSELENNPHLFTTRIVSRCESREAAFDRELEIQRRLKVVESPLYINKSLAKGNFTCTQHSKITREKMRQSHLGHVHSAETRAKIAEKAIGRKITEETRRKQSEARKGRKMRPRSEETKRKISESRKAKFAAQQLVDGTASG